jgi:hypothetical protein
VFAADTVAVAPIREDQEYGGERVTFDVRLGTARVTLQVDIGFGDAVTPKPERVSFPTLLGMETPKLRAYPKETVVAEKLDAMVKLGMANSRMKDFYDVVVLSRTFEFDGMTLRDAIRARFTRRGTATPSTAPVALTEAFAADSVKQRQWKAFVTKSGLHDSHKGLAPVVTELATFLVPPMEAASNSAEFKREWKAPNLEWVPSV